jgi:hypothetical protein
MLPLPCATALPGHGRLPGRPISSPEPNPSPSAKTEPAINSLGSPPLSPFRFPARVASMRRNCSSDPRNHYERLRPNLPPPMNLATSPPSYSLLLPPTHPLMPFTHFGSTAKPRSRRIPDAPAPPATAPRKPRT